MFACLLPLSLALLAPSDDVTRRQAQAHHKAGLELMTAESFEAASEEFKKAVVLDPLFVMAHYNLGQSYMALKRYVEAAIAYEASKEAFLRVTALSDKDRFERERAAAEEISEIRRGIDTIRSGQIKTQQPQMMILRLESRLAVLEGMKARGNEVASVPAEVHLALGSAYYRQNKLEDAERAYVLAVRQNNRLGAAHNNLAVIYMLSGRYKEARASIKAAEQAGFPVPSGLKADLEKRASGGGQ